MNGEEASPEAVTGSLLVAETMHAIRVIAMGLGMKDAPLPELPPPQAEE